jgi:hypothetical protein
MMLALLLAAAPCIDVTDGVPGWKQVALPAEAPHLAAPPALSQFRSGERVTVIDEQTGLYRTGVANGGSTDFELPLATGSHSVTLVFREPLRGAKVDVTSWDMTLVHEKRVAGTQLSFEWGGREVPRLWVRVHQHLREPPVLMEVRVVRSVWPQQLGLPGRFFASKSLFFFQPDAAPVRLCEAAEQMQIVRADQLALAR